MIAKMNITTTFITESRPSAKKSPMSPGPWPVTSAPASGTSVIGTMGLARLGLFLALTVVIQLAAWLIGAPVPLVMSALLALLVAFPLSMLIFPRMRVEATQAVAARHEHRKQRKEWIREELAGR